MADSLAEVRAYGMRKPYYFQGPKAGNRNWRATLFCIDGDGVVVSEP